MKLILKILKRKLVRGLIVATVLAVPGVIWFQRWSLAPASTTIHINAVVKTASATLPTYKPLDLPQFTTEVPASWHIRINDQSTDQSHVVSFAPSGDVGQAAFTAAPLPTTGLSEVADYHLRLGDGQNYSVLPVSQVPGVTALFADNVVSDGYTAFVVHGQSYISISVNEFANNEASRATLNHIVKQLVWK